MPNTNLQLFCKSFGNFEITKYHEPDSLKTLVIDDVNYQITHNIVNSGEPVSGVSPMTPGDTTLKLNSFLLKRDNARLFEALRNPTTDGLGAAACANGNNTQQYTQVKVVTGFKQVGNPSEFQDVVLKFFK
jgi:hypothetical protein